MITSVYISAQIPSDKLMWIFKQINSGISNFNEFNEKYLHVKGYQKLFIDCMDEVVKIID
jgi:hypothetical protein